MWGIRLFINSQTEESITKYIELLKITSSLSNLFSDSTQPFLYYRAMENIFSKAFNADNLSRSDLSVDASKNSIGIGLKTFLHGNGYTFQKIAEFNKQSHLLKNLSETEIIIEVSKMRNERINTTMNICELDTVMYHLITRSDHKFMIFEEKMDYIDIDNIKIKKINNATIIFEDSENEYNFNKSKSTLYKRFNTNIKNCIKEFEINILSDPYEFLLTKYKKLKIEESNLKKESLKDYIILPLYSPKYEKVMSRSGLNLWNAKGRKRNENEVEIRIPSWIHKTKLSFFEYTTSDYKTDPFKVKLPNDKIITMKVSQSGGKALMSNPNHALGQWLLREVLKIEENKLVTKDLLDRIGIDSIKLTKVSNNLYELDFLKTGSFLEYETNNLKSN